MFQFLTFVFVAVVGSLIYLDQKYDTSSPCDALAQVVVRETPGALDLIGDRYFGIRIGRLAGRVLDPEDEVVQDIAHDFVLEQTSATDPIECMGATIAADVNGGWFREKLAERIEAEVRERF